MNRRNFLKGMLAVGVAAAVPTAIGTPPVQTFTYVAMHSVRIRTIYFCHGQRLLHWQPIAELHMVLADSLTVQWTPQSWDDVMPEGTQMSVGCEMDLAPGFDLVGPTTEVGLG